MKNIFFILIPVLILAAVASGCTTTRHMSDATISTLIIPETQREFRAVWIATVANIDWPSEPGLSVERQKAELRAQLDRAKAVGLNAVIFQVRPATDAIYLSNLEPWSEYLTGTQGVGPDPAYDPLAFVIDEAHKRGLELHAWFNPFRSRHSSGSHILSPGHIMNHKPHLVREYGRHLWLDPGEQESRDYSVQVMLDVVKRYDVDGIHIDDYFYPYKERGEDGELLDFPDDLSFARYVASYGEIDRNDWRRQNVDIFVEQLYNELRLIDNTVRFGISPFGIWRPGYPEGIEGFDAYEQIYADALKWLQNGWLDYFTPQLYWPIEQEAQSYARLLNWWHEMNAFNRHLWPGNFTSRVGERWPAQEIIDQIEITRAQQGAEGNVHFSMRAFLRDNDNMNERLMLEVYADPALVPATTWLGTGGIEAPEGTFLQRAGRKFAAIGYDTPSPWLWVVKTHNGERWSTSIVPGSSHEFEVPADSRRVVVHAVNRLGIESEPAELIFQE